MYQIYFLLAAAETAESVFDQNERVSYYFIYVRRQAERVDAENAVFVISNNRINNYCRQSHSKFNTYVCTSYTCRSTVR